MTKEWTISYEKANSRQLKARKITLDNLHRAKAERMLMSEFNGEVPFDAEAMKKIVSVMIKYKRSKSEF